MLTAGTTQPQPQYSIHRSNKKKNNNFYIWIRIGFTHILIWKLWKLLVITCGRRLITYMYDMKENVFFLSFMGSEITQISILLRICGLISEKLTELYEKLSFYANAFLWNRLYLFKSFDHATNVWSMLVATQWNILLVVLFLLSKAYSINV